MNFTISSDKIRGNDSSLGWNSSCLSHPAIEEIVKMVSCSLLTGFGVFSNVFVIVLAIKYTPRKSLHPLIINMAVADSLFVLFDFGHFLYFDSFFLACEVAPRNVKDVLFNFCFRVVTAETLITLFIISIERYRATRRITRISRPPSMKRMAIVITLSWLTSISISVPLLLQSSFLKAILSYLSLVIIIYILNILFSFLTLWNISKPTTIENNLSEVQRKQRQQRIRNSVKLVLYSLLLYSCCYLPLGIFSIPSMVDLLSISHCFAISLKFVYYYILPLTNFCFSPLIYCACLADFRNAVKNLLAWNRVEPSRRRSNSAEDTRM